MVHNSYIKAFCLVLLFLLGSHFLKSKTPPSGKLFFFLKIVLKNPVPLLEKKQKKNILGTPWEQGFLEKNEKKFFFFLKFLFFFLFKIPPSPPPP